MSGEKSRAKKVEKKIDDSCPAAAAAAVTIRAFVRSFRSFGGFARLASMPSFLPSMCVSAQSGGMPEETKSSFSLLFPSLSLSSYLSPYCSEILINTLTMRKLTFGPDNEISR